MKKVTLTVMALLFTAVIATTAFGLRPGERGPVMDPARGAIFGDRPGLNLTAEQKAKIKELRDAQFKEIKPLREQMFTKRDELRKLWLEPSPDQAKITAAQKEMRSLRDQMQDKMTAFRLEALKVLTPEQQEKAKSFAAGYSAGRGSGPGRGFGKGRGFGPGALRRWWLPGRRSAGGWGNW